MPTFAYAARDARGIPARGKVEAADASRAQTILQQQGYFITALRPLRIWTLAARERSPRHEDIVALTHELSALIGAGLPLLPALQTLREQAHTPVLAGALHAVQADIEAGRALSQALGKHPQLFSTFYVAMIRAGEAAGALDWTLQQLAAHLERDMHLRRKLQGMLLYPGLVLSLAAVVAGVFTVLIIPAFERVYRSAGATLPLPTLVLVAVSHFVRSYGPVLLLLGVAGAIAARGRWRHARPAVARIFLRLPHVGRLARLVVADRFIRTLGMMLHSGLPVLTALEVAAGVVDHPDVASAVAAIIEAITRGRRLSEPMRGHALFPPMVIRMVAVGERSGTLDQMLAKAAEVLDRDVDYTLQRTMAMLEPLLTIVLGAVIGFLLIALYLPIFGLGRAVLR